MREFPTSSPAPLAPSAARRAAPIDVWIVVFPRFLLLDATGPVQVFASANDEAVDAGQAAPYRIHVVARDGGAVPSSSGVSLMAQPLPESLPQSWGQNGRDGATVIVSGGRIADLPSHGSGAGRDLLRWIERAGATAARCCGVCTGAFLLARAGLLDGRRATTHWQDVAALRACHPALEVEDDAVFVKDGKFYTSAGISAGMDLALGLVDEDLGRAVALAVARRLVLFLKRPGGQRQFSAELLSPASGHGVCAQLSAWLQPRLRQQVDIDAMAAACALSVRTLHRRLRQEADITPARLLARLRLEHACRMLETPGMTLKRAARESGYQSQYNLRRAFVVQLGVLPSEYQSRFA